MKGNARTVGAIKVIVSIDRNCLRQKALHIAIVSYPRTLVQSYPLTRPDFCLQFFVVITLKLPNQFVMGNVEPEPCWVKRKGVRCPFAFVMV
jgi:hypothetical protein